MKFRKLENKDVWDRRIIHRGRKKKYVAEVIYTPGHPYHYFSIKTPQGTSFNSHWKPTTYGEYPTLESACEAAEKWIDSDFEAINKNRTTEIEGTEQP
ncbi:hypothetical protein PP175_26200 (plasmid) [Aneurinibacillus sp. Ricciae_BoGa-3]|uniref:hypothetical protein n=1 Tax=Aneurinibacillus sp. Ricciae_BoGa-3 TaxID=3022697 RepID=UPI00233FE3D2|nr:hypothetical protein [Aneurinibacillus sp. Ricciae_BoGa-3]WCK57560.1 hypothetical protein PP175_26200 [Aneurinibacillus sp. Ricciae_BoGa-3]